MVGVARIDVTSEDDINGGGGVRVPFGGNDATVFPIVADGLLIPEIYNSNEKNLYSCSFVPIGI